MVGEGEMFETILCIINAKFQEQNFPFRIKKEMGAWLITWHHKDGLKSHELLPDPIPEVTLRMWKKSGLKFNFRRI